MWSPIGHPDVGKLIVLFVLGVAVLRGGYQDNRNEKDRGCTPGLSVSC
jgi:hypothetical protein